MVKVVLCVCTCRRPEGLSRLLEAVAQADFDGSLSVVVVDNDVGGEGAAVCQRVSKTYRWPLMCVSEPQRGISHARNRAVQTALEQRPDFIVTLDDDEWPSQGWLRELLRIQTAKNADAVGGPVVPVFPPNSEPWSTFVEYYNSDQRLPDGEHCLLYATCTAPWL